MASSQTNPFVGDSFNIDYRAFQIAFIHMLPYHTSAFLLPCSSSVWATRCPEDRSSNIDALKPSCHFVRSLFESSVVLPPINYSRSSDPFPTRRFLHVPRFQNVYFHELCLQPVCMTFPRIASSCEALAARESQILGTLSHLRMPFEPGHQHDHRETLNATTRPFFTSSYSSLQD
jgi:hypothetical protein